MDDFWDNIVGIYRQLQRHVHTDNQALDEQLIVPSPHSFPVIHDHNEICPWAYTQRDTCVHAMRYVRGPTQNEIRVHAMLFVRAERDTCARQVICIMYARNEICVHAMRYV